MLDRERLKLDKYLVGVKEMGRLPGAMFVVDAKREAIAVREANRLGIPVIAITDTNADPSPINFPIPANDDAIRSVGLICGAIATTIESTKREVPDDQRRSEDVEATTYSTETGETTEKDRPAAKKRPRRKRRPRPEVIAQRLKGEDDGAEGSEDDGDGVDEGDEVETEAPAAAAAVDSGSEAEAEAPKPPRKPRAKKPAAAAAVAEGGEEAPKAE